jgi:hypothetical protein
VHGYPAYHHDSARSEVVESEADEVCNSAERAVFGGGEEASGSEGEGTEEVVGNSWSHFQSAHVSQAVVEIAGNLGEEVGFGGDGDVEGNMAVSVELEGAEAAAGIVERVEAQVHEEHKVGVDRRLVVGRNTVASGDAGELAVGAGVGRAVADVGVAVAANRIGYHHNHSSRIKQTAQREDAVAGPVGRDSIVGCNFRNQAAGRDCGLWRRTNTRNNPPGVGVEGEGQGVGAVVVDCKVEAEKDFFA